MKVAISAGHNPVAQGAQCGALTEYVAAVDWLGALQPAIEEYGHDVFVVPTGALATKIGAINAEKCDVAVEVHFNSDPLHMGRGCETLYMPGSRDGEMLARTVQTFLAGVLPPDRGAKEGWYRMDRPGHADFVGDVEGDEIVDAFLRLTHCPAIIVEPCFIHEIGVIAMRAVGARAVARGVADFLHE